MTQDTNISISGIYRFCKKPYKNVAIKFFQLIIDGLSFLYRVSHSEVYKVNQL